jgi:hypothetical protein
VQEVIDVMTREDRAPGRGGRTYQHERTQLPSVAAYEQGSLYSDDLGQLWVAAPGPQWVKANIVTPTELRRLRRRYGWLFAALAVLLPATVTMLILTAIWHTLVVVGVAVLLLLAAVLVAIPRTNKRILGCIVQPDFDQEFLS